MREFRKKGKKHTTVWQIWTSGDEVHMQSGVLGGKLQHTYDVPGPVGKEGTKAYVEPEAQAILVCERKIKKKVEEGYVEFDPDAIEAELLNLEIDFTKLPKSLSFFKPRRWPTDGRGLNKLLTLTESDNAIYTVKRDGMMHPVLITEKGSVKIYTRRMDDCTKSYPHLVEAFDSMNLPAGTILLCEFVIPNSTGAGDDRDHMASIARSLPERARKLQQMGAKAEAVVLSVPFLCGEYQFDKPIWMNFDLISEMKIDNLYVSPIHILHTSFENAKTFCQVNKLEGLVIYNGDAKFGSQGYNFRGTPERPECWKCKSEYEDDFVIVWDPKEDEGSFGSGRIKNLPGRVSLYQADITGCFHYICGCGSGFTDAVRQEIMDRARDNGGSAGVAIIKYVSRSFIREGGKSNALKEPVFVGWHADKKEIEAMNKKL